MRAGAPSERTALCEKALQDLADFSSDVRLEGGVARTQRKDAYGSVATVAMGTWEDCRLTR